MALLLFLLGSEAGVFVVGNEHFYRPLPSRTHTADHTALLILLLLPFPRTPRSTSHEDASAAPFGDACA